MEDARKARANFSITELYQLLQCLEESLSNFISVRHAVLHHDPTATAFTMMADQNNPTSNYKVKVFTTQKAALHWLKSAE
jgi:hypothetical protein